LRKVSLEGYAFERTPIQTNYYYMETKPNKRRRPTLTTLSKPVLLARIWVDAATFPGS